MKVCIFTVYNSENYGSYWQARALGDYLMAHGHEIAYLRRDMRGASHSRLALVRRLGRSIVRADFPTMWSEAARYRLVNDAQQFLNVVDSEEGFDACVIGSDTLWNLRQKHFSMHRETYWGGTLSVNKKFTYAVSIGDATEVEMASDPRLSQWARNLTAVSVRDESSQAVLMKVMGLKTRIVCDPTLLVERNYWKDVADPLNDVESCIVLYHFGHLPSDMLTAICEYADAKGLRVVSLASHEHGIDWIPALDVQEFIRMFSAASLVVTNTFHGVMFSIAFQRECIINAAGKAKVEDAAMRFCLEGRVWRPGIDPRGIASLPTNWQAVDNAVQKTRKESREYLQRVLG